MENLLSFFFSSAAPPPPPPPKPSPPPSSISSTTFPKPQHLPKSPFLSLSTSLCYTLDSLITTFLDPPHRHPHLNPNLVLSNNFSPLPPLPPTPCPPPLRPLPSSLSGGVYIRNGPNPFLPPSGPHHLIDGDGMLHSLLLPSSTSPSSPPLFSSRFVLTYRHLLELHSNFPLFPSSLLSFHGLPGLHRVAVQLLRILTGQYNPLLGFGLANTGLLFFSNSAFALCESDLPYSFFISPDTGDTTTLSRHDFNGELHTSMTAHPKIDPVSGELLTFRYSLTPPFLTFFRFDNLGRKLSDVPIHSLRHPTVIHDFAITQRFAIFSDVQLIMKLLLTSLPVHFDAKKTPRLGLLPLDAIDDSEMRWFDVPGFNMMHSVNAWDEDDGAGGLVVVLVGLNMVGDSMKNLLERMELLRSRLEMVRIYVNSGKVTRTMISAENLEFGSVNQEYVGRRNRYVYAGVAAPNPKISGVVKVDLEGERVVGRREFGLECYAGEPCYVPAREGEGGGEEDDGYLVTYVHDERKEESRFVVMDARSPELEVVTEVALPRRVPYGFHGIFITEAQLRSQRPVTM
ncbi:putative oxidoreductase [Dioscorea sansibarensis]